MPGIFAVLFVYERKTKNKTKRLSNRAYWGDIQVPCCAQQAEPVLSCAGLSFDVRCLIKETYLIPRISWPASGIVKCSLASTSRIPLRDIFILSIPPAFDKDSQDRQKCSTAEKKRSRSETGSDLLSYLDHGL